MNRLDLFCFAVTPFTKSGGLDEDAMRQFMQRFVDHGLGVYVASGGGGEGHALTRPELKRVYELGVEVGGGKIPVQANPPEQHTARMAIEHARIAAEAGIDVVHLYTLAGWHGMKPTDPELMGYFGTVLDEVTHPIALAVNPTMGYVPSSSLVAKVANRYKQVVAIKFTGTTDAYFLDVKNAMDRELDYHLGMPGSMNSIGLGATALFGSEGNIIPKTLAAYRQGLQAADVEAASVAYAHLRRFDQYVRKWNPSNPRWLKMAVHVLRLPGWEGGLREPYQMPSAKELDGFAEGLRKLAIPEIDEQMA